MRPHQLLPIKHPMKYDPSIKESDYFYKNIIKPLQKDFIRIMDNYLTIDWEAVKELDKTIDEVLDIVETTLSKNIIIQEFQEHQYPKKFEEYKEKVFESIRKPDYYLKEYDGNKMVHRTYAVNHILELQGKEGMKKDKWSVKDCKALYEYSGDLNLNKIINKIIEPNNIIVLEAMEQLAKDKAAVWNRPRENKVKEVKKEDLVPSFNPGSGLQKKELFEYLGIEPLAFSKTSGEASWGRPQIEELLATTTDETLIEVLQMFIDYSFSAIIKNNFLESFESFTIENRLYANMKLFGAKSFRPTGNSPNFLQLPSTGSIYAKPLKKCLVAPEGYLVATIDYSALEDRVIANLSEDENKIAVFTDGIDGHSLAATYYFPSRVEKVIGKYTDNKEAAKLFKTEVDKGNKDAKKIRQNGKGVTFGLSYGAYPPKVAATIKCSTHIAEKIFTAYHEEMYPGITKFREKGIIPYVKQYGYNHLGFGCRLYSSDINKDSRTLFNASSQFWSILTLLAINELHYEIDKAGLQKDIVVTATIYDSIYFVIKDDVKTIKWLNETIVPIMNKPWLEDEVVHNECNLEIGDSWANLLEIPNEATEKDIQNIKEKI